MADKKRAPLHKSKKAIKKVRAKATATTKATSRVKKETPKQRQDRILKNILNISKLVGQVTTTKKKPNKVTQPKTVVKKKDGRTTRTKSVQREFKKAGVHMDIDQERMR